MTEKNFKAKKQKLDLRIAAILTEQLTEFYQDTGMVVEGVTFETLTGTSGIRKGEAVPIATVVECQTYLKGV